MKYDITVAIIGTGFMGRTHAAAFDKTVSKMILCSTDEEAGKALAEQYGCSFYNDIDEMLDKERIDAVSVCLPTHLHCSVSKKVMERGISVLCEKPFATSLEEAEEMVECSERNGVRLMIAHCVRFSKNAEYLRRCIADQRFGKLVYFNSWRNGERPKWSVGNWLMNTSISGGAVRDLHVHDTDVIVGFLGVPQSVYTVGNEYMCRTVYNYGDGSTVSASAGWRNVSGIPEERGYEAAFERGCIKRIGDSVTVYVDNKSLEPLEKEEFSEFFTDDIYANEIKYFCHCLVSGEENTLCPVSDSLRTMRVSCAESRSLANMTEEKI